MSAADLAALSDEMASASLPQADPAGPVAAAPEADPVAENLAYLDLLLEAAEPLAPAVVARYTPARRLKVAQAFTAVCLKRGWDVDLWLGNFGEELMLAFAVVGPVAPLALAAWQQSRAPKAPALPAPASGAPSAPAPAPAAPVPPVRPPGRVELSPAP